MDNRDVKQVCLSVHGELYVQASLGAIVDLVCPFKLSYHWLEDRREVHHFQPVMDDFRYLIVSTSAVGCGIIRSTVSLIMRTSRFARAEKARAGVQPNTKS